MHTTIEPGDYAKFRSFLEQSSGIVLGENKYYLVQSRLNRLLRDYKIATIGELLKRLQSPSDRKLRAEVVDAMTLLSYQLDNREAQLNVLESVLIVFIHLDLAAYGQSPDSNDHMYIMPLQVKRRTGISER